MVVALSTASLARVRAESVQAQRGAGRGNIEADVIATSNRWYEAVNKGDAAALEALESDDFLSFQQLPQGLAEMSKSAQLEALKKLPPGTRIQLQRELSNVRVRTYGTVAILTAVATYRGQSPRGQPVATQGLTTELWVNMDGRWRISHFQPANIPPKPQGTPGR